MERKKVVVLGGGTGLSVLLRGLKEFPVDITAIVSVCDDGRSTGRIRREFNVPALGDIRRDVIALSEVEPLFEKMFNYRFRTTGELDGHTVGNLILVAMTEITGSVSKAIVELGKVFNLKGKVLPLTEDSDNTLMAEMTDGSIVEGEHKITEAGKKIKKIYYKKKPQISKAVIESIIDADLIILSIGSLYTSVLPNLIAKDVVKAIDKSNAKIMYICNMMTQPGETDNYTVSDHVKTINNYLNKRKLDVVISNDSEISPELIEKYKVLEQKDPVILDEIELYKIGITVIKDNFVTVEEEMIRHNTIKLATQIFSYLIENK